MDSFEWNKVVAALLSAALLFLGLKELGHAVYHPHVPEELAYKIDYAVEGAGEVVEEAEPDLAVLLAEASVSAGERQSAKCKACHSFDEGGPNGTGPNLWGIVGSDAAQASGFSYSAAMTAFGQPWSYETLFAYIESPRKVVEGTSMSFAGIRGPQDRANLLAYLATLDANPVPFPEPAVVETEAAMSDVVETVEEAVETLAEETAVDEAATDLVEEIEDAVSETDSPQ